VLGTTSPKNTAEFLEVLPKRLHERIIGEIPIELDSPIKEILEKTHDLIENYEENKMRELIDQLIVLSAKGKEATIGLENVAHAVHQKRVRMVLVDDQFEQPGFQCPSCSFISPYLENCPYCNIKMEKRADIVDELLEEAIIEKSELLFIKNKELSEKIENIGAFLRF